MGKFIRKDQSPLCACGCGKRVERNKQYPKRWNRYIYGHYIRVNNPMKRPEIAMKFTGKNNCMRNPEVIAKKSGKNHHYYNKKRSTEDCEKISKSLIALDENHPSKRKEHKKRVSERMLSLGENHPSKTPEARERMKRQKYAKGYKHTEEFKKNASERMLILGDGHWMKNPEYRKRAKKFLAEIRPDMFGENHPQWKGSIAAEPYCDIWLDQEFKDSIRKRDNQECQNPDCWKTSDKLCGHHIDYNKKNCHPQNIITVCFSCNSRANKDREYWCQFYRNIMSEKYGYDYKIKEVRKEYKLEILAI